MITVSKGFTALAFGLAVTALASPSLAQRSEGRMSADREAAIRECNGKAGKFTMGTWATTHMHTYRTCMAEHGQPE